MVEGRGGKEQGSFRTRAGANTLPFDGRTGWKRTGFFSHTYWTQSVAVLVEERGGKGQSSFRTRIGANRFAVMMKGRGGKEQCSLRTRTGVFYYS
jgi:hypothetical protein